MTHCFVNLGSDHPSIIEAITKGQIENKGQFPRIITCPNEMVALSMADGYARVTGKPLCVIVHVDVGTQGLGFVLPRPIIPLFKPIGSPETLSRDLRARPESKVLTWRNTTEQQYTMLVAVGLLC